MLEQIRKNSRSVVTSILFSVLIAAFVISINHTPARCNADIASDVDYAIAVQGTEIPQKEFLFAYELSPGKRYAAYFPGQESRFKGQVLDALIERELLVHAAEGMGLRVDEAEASEMISQGKAFMMGHPFPLKPDPSDKNQRGFGFVDGKLNYKQLEQILTYFGLTVRQFLEIQQRELLADKLRQLMKLSTKVTTDEVKQTFADRNVKVNLEYVRFFKTTLAQNIPVNVEDVAAYAATHEADLKKLYEERKGNYQKLGPQVHLHRIWIRIGKEGKDAKEDQIAAQTQSAITKLNAALEALKGGAKFSDVAKTVTENQQPKGGDMGWQRKGAIGFDKELEEKVFAAQPLDFIGPEKTSQGIELIQVDGFREGDISFEAAKIELAEELFRIEKSKEMEKVLSQTTVAALQAGKKLTDLYPKALENSPPSLESSNVHTEETGFVDKQGDEIHGIGSSKELTKAVFSKKPGELIGPLEVNGATVLAIIKERKDPDWKTFEETKEKLQAELIEEKANQNKARWANDRCKEAKQAGKIRVNMALLQQDNPAAGQNQDFQSMLSTFTYEPCQPSKGMLPF